MVQTAFADHTKDLILDKYLSAIDRHARLSEVDCLSRDEEGGVQCSLPPWQ